MTFSFRSSTFRGSTVRRACIRTTTACTVSSDLSRMPPLELSLRRESGAVMFHHQGNKIINILAHSLLVILCSLWRIQRYDIDLLKRNV